MIAKDKEIGNIQYFAFKNKYKLLVLRWEKKKKKKSGSIAIWMTLGNIYVCSRSLLYLFREKDKTVDPSISE